MTRIHLTLLLLLCCPSFWVTAQLKSKRICVKSGFEKQCNTLERETQEIKCVKVQDSIECANLLRNGSSGFGIFSAESTLLLAALHYEDLTILKELRHVARQTYPADFESVVIVKATHANGLEGLKGLNYCHPGLYYDHTERWSERFLKHFERSLTIPNCEKNLKSPVEIEIDSLASHFSSACYPGSWSNNPEEDQRLKKKYPQLCELCNSPYSPCAYTDTNRHIGALRCLIGKGGVAYVSLQDTLDFFGPTSEYANLRNDYAYLCPNGNIQLLSDNSRTPCTWLRQPWPVIISNYQDSVPLKAAINRWFYGTSSWEMAVKEILTADSLNLFDTSIQKPRDFFYPYREVPFSQPICSTQAKWCTKSFEEKEKCDLLQTAGVTTGIQPIIECNNPVGGALNCLKEVNEERADFTSIDSNLGYIARHPYNLTTALYGETDKDASVVVVVHANSNFKRFEDLQNSKACIAEYNGIASVAFINVGKNLGFLPKDHCNHTRLLGEFFGPSCVPGAFDPHHGINEFQENLCSLCLPIDSSSTSIISSTGSQPHFAPIDRDIELTTKSNLQSELEVLNTVLDCNAEQTNRFYGDLGALYCLHTKGDVAILGLKDLNENAKALAIDPNEYRIICKNGSLAEYTGFEVDSNCALASFVDSEIVVKPANSKIEGIINAFISYEKYFKVDPELSMFGTFNGHKNLLFNTKTTGFASYEEKDLGPVVDNYNQLFKSLDACGNAFKSIPPSIFIYTTLFFTVVLSRLLQ